MIKFKRILVFLIDSFITLLMAGYIKTAAHIRTTGNIFSAIFRSYQDFQFGDTTVRETINNIANIIYNNDKNNVLSLFIMIVTIIITWIIIPYLFNEQTIGMKLLKLKLEMNKKYDLKAITIRALLLSGLGILIISIIFLYIANGLIYSLLTLILLIIQIILIICDGFMVLYSSNGHNIVDNVSHTKIVEVIK